MRELMREILSANLTFTGIVLTLAAMVVFYGSVYLILFTNLGKKLAFLIVGATVSGWLTINNLLFVLYAPRGPRPANIEGLTWLEIRIIPFAAMLATFILFLMFLTALHRYETARDREG